MGEEQVQSLLGKFDIGSGKVVVEPITSINDSIIKKYASQIKPYVAFKKGGGNCTISCNENKS